MGEFLQGDGRSGEVEIRAMVDGVVTTVFVRQLQANDAWWVVGSASANVVIEQPQTLTRVSSPLVVSGQARAFEGVVAIELRADGGTEPLASATAVGSGDENLGPFLATLRWSSSGQGWGSLIVFTRSARDGRVAAASTIRVQL